MHRFLWRALCSGCCALLPLSAAAQDATVRPKVRLAAPQPRPALTSPISVPARIDVTVPVPPQTMIVGHSATLDVQVKSVAVSQPIVLSAQAGGERTFQFIPPQIVGSGVAKLTVGPALGDAPGQLEVNIDATAGGVVANTKVTLHRDDPSCGDGPPNLSWELLDPRFGYQRDKLPGRALVRLFVKNEGGKIGRPATLRIHNIIGTKSGTGYLSGPRLQNGQIGMLDIPVRGGCARIVFDGDIDAQSHVKPEVCGGGSQFSMGIGALIQILGADFRSFKPVTASCKDAKLN